MLRTSLTRVLRGAVISLTLFAAGCNGTLHSRWVTEADTVDLWSMRMSELPIHLHRDGQDAVAQNRDGTPWTARQGAAEIERHRRLELYIGGHQFPDYGSICSTSAVMQPDGDTKPGILTVAVLCDGPRLVALAQDHLKTERAQPGLPLYRLMARRLLHAIDISVAQSPVQQYG
jgi:hypothetical protein